ncbi:MAG TPA: hypothetical protein VHH88_09175 [Verrucomicrobiae bacterium]|nr:hypothetical protein [Verrucomicrobiae bacterium]
MESLQAVENTGTASRVMGTVACDGPDLLPVAPVQEVLFASTPRRVCDEMGLNWWAALKLYEDGWLSFSPEQTSRMDETQEAELRFVGALILAGCDRRMLASMLSTLPKPYAYHGSRLYYDWTRRHWRVLPDPKAHPEATFAEWLERLVQQGDVESLNGVLELAHDAMGRLHAHLPQRELPAR